MHDECVYVFARRCFSEKFCRWSQELAAEESQSVRHQYVPVWSASNHWQDLRCVLLSCWVDLSWVFNIPHDTKHSALSISNLADIYIIKTNYKQDQCKNWNNNIRKPLVIGKKLNQIKMRPSLRVFYTIWSGNVSGILQSIAQSPE